MAFLMLSSQKSLLTMKKNQLQFEYSCKLNEVQYLKKKEADLAKEKKEIAEDTDYEWDMKNDPEYTALVKDEELLTVETDNLQSQISIIDAELGTMKTMVQNDIKQATSLNLLGGG